MNQEIRILVEASTPFAASEATNEIRAQINHSNPDIEIEQKMAPTDPNHAGGLMESLLTLFPGALIVEKISEEVLKYLFDWIRKKINEGEKVSEPVAVGNDIVIEKTDINGNKVKITVTGVVNVNEIIKSY